MGSDLSSLLGGSGGGSGSSIQSLIFPAGFTTLFAIFMIITSIASLAVLVFYVMNALVTYKAHRAAIETRDILKEMNERDKARSFKTILPATSTVDQSTDSVTRSEL